MAAVFIRCLKETKLKNKTLSVTIFGMTKHFTHSKWKKRGHVWYEKLQIL